MDENGNNASKGTNEKLAIGSLVCGLASFFFFPLAFGSVGIALGLIVQDREEPGSRAYQNARCGIICGIVGLALWIVALFVQNYLNLDLSSLFGGQSGASNSASAF